ncbi:maf protein [Hyphomicrobium denitrificans ATCC 51888]|uniref:Nucleoside triphosphate pyrophosphatase n=1 Tax=Hyphomicrobium denitrificans (strain ATCC 51888 / DSM 1869 / NCIMB 11706 / TK 0415) TaxID=582899 RepID=D8JWV8_HYPDA|nr:Maf family protein [Hyphomicrobium denitrificans]ADJ25066.1 maf protein [Hyphomicrobium denitrificans ATCC 51888]
MPEATRLILASGSAARRTLLEATGLIFDVIPANIDEGKIRDAIVGATANVEGSDIASVLAAEKARLVSIEHPNALVVGADQVLTLGGKFFSKAENLAEAREILSMLRGRTHELVSAVALARNGEVHWQTSATAEMTMRSFSDEFLGCYLEKMGERALQIVGCYEIEGPGVQLFEEIDGDYFTILGIPLLELLARLRHEGMVTA